jgi:hypothetical protein
MIYSFIVTMQPCKRLFLDPYCSLNDCIIETMRNMSKPVVNKPSYLYVTKGKLKHVFNLLY